MEYQHLSHGFEPVYNADSRILILGSFPSVKSRENHFYYGHPQNRFWRLLSSLLEEPLPQTVEEKKAMLLRRGIALWDVVAECDIRGSSDLSIRGVVPCDLSRILSAADIRLIAANGSTAHRLYRRFCQPFTGREAIKLPSTSPANAAWPLDRLQAAWQEALSLGTLENHEGEVKPSCDH